MSAASIVRKTLLADCMKQKIRQMMMQIQEMKQTDGDPNDEHSDKISETDDKVVEIKDDEFV